MITTIKKGISRRKQHQRAKRNSNPSHGKVKRRITKKNKPGKMIGGGIASNAAAVNSGNPEKFEVTTLDHVDTSKFSISKYVNKNIEWGVMPGAPPTDCCIM